MTKNFVAEVVKIEDVAEDVKSFTLVATAGAMLPRFDAGAHIDIWATEDIARQYSMAGDPANPDTYMIVVQRENRGGTSDWLHDSVSAGDLISLSGPRNNFPIATNAVSHLLVAGGIGITPFLSMIPQLERTRADWRLIYCTRSPARTAFREQLAERHTDRVRFVHDGGHPAHGLDVVSALSLVDPGQHLYCCGPAGLMQAVKVASAHWPAGTVHFEFFSQSSSRPGVVEGAFEIEIASTGHVYLVPPHRSILSVLREHKIYVNSACQEGLCGTCITGVVSGIPDHRDTVLDEAEKASNKLMTVCCSRARSARLVLDL